ncbi:MAG: peptide-methionine (R)-S-oxide reductase MsrB [Rubricoccaceae bacterium]
MDRRTRLLWPFAALGALALVAAVFTWALAPAGARTSAPTDAEQQAAAAALRPAPLSANDNRPFWETTPLPSRETLRETLSPMQFHVLFEDGTEPPFRNAYHDHKEDGLYVDLVTGEPLFSSRDKYDSGTGWPSFTRPIDPAHVTTRPDPKYAGLATEVRAARSDAHLGHVFDDGPAPTGLRYCINSAALRFVPAARLAEEGYGAYAALFE